MQQQQPLSNARVENYHPLQHGIAVCSKLEIDKHTTKISITKEIFHIT